MSAEAGAATKEGWAKLEGHVVNGVFPLLRLLGGSDHSGVFLTRAGQREDAELAIKLVPIVPSLPEEQAALWREAATLHHPHLLRIFDTSRCQIDGAPYLYAVMEYSDQNLAELLARRALTEDETREMLTPVLSALSFLHGKKIVQGGLKPSNILVVGDQIKLACDTIRHVGDPPREDRELSVYGAPESLDGPVATASDVWAFGVTMCEAVTRYPPAGLHGGDAVSLPPELPPTFRYVVARCLSRAPQGRPKVVELEAWTRGRHLPPAAHVDPQKAPAPVVREEIITGPVGYVEPQPARSTIVVSEYVPPSPAAVVSEQASTSSPLAAESEHEHASPPSVALAVEHASAPPATAESGQFAALMPTAGSGQFAALTSAAEEQLAPPSAVAVNEPFPPPSAAGSEQLSASSAAAEDERLSGPSPAAESDHSRASTNAAASKRASPSPRPPRTQRGPASLVVGGIVVVALVWVGWLVLSSVNWRSSEDGAAPALAATVRNARSQASDSLPDGERAAEQASAALPRVVATKGPGSPAAGSLATGSPGAGQSQDGIQEVIPDVPLRARSTIRGRVRVSVRVIVEKDGTVFAALTENAGPSRYFERLAIDAAKKWTFPPVDTDAERLMLVRFQFGRDGTTASATPVQ